MNALRMRVRLGLRFAKTAITPTPQFPICVKNNQETLDYIIANEPSVVRFGDGEVLLMCGKKIGYQEYDAELAIRMKKILNTPSSEKLVVCIPDVFRDLNRYRLPVKLWWEEHLNQYREFYSGINSDSWFGSAFISRPYIDKKSKLKSTAKSDFEKLKLIWENKDILIVEGAYTRSGVGNDLFDGARTAERILCPPNNAYSKYETIKACIEEHAKDKLILLMLGPTAKLLAYDLSEDGFRAFDIGHIDSEYEWYKMGAKKKVKLENKHSAEWNSDEEITDIRDEKYRSQIICDLSGLTG